MSISLDLFVVSNTVGKGVNGVESEFQICLSKRFDHGFVPTPDCSDKSGEFACGFYVDDLVVAEKCAVGGEEA